MKLSDILQSLSGGNQETLEEKAVRLEKQAIKLEADARLRKRIADAEKRIKAVKPSGGLGGFGGGGGGGIVELLQRNRILVGIVVVIGIILLIAKACS